ncbi:MAG: hypothetical protein N3B15_06170 [Planctomycetota bacterium]|nr:hypothetical protein [Planctomycetota bacterium]
MPPWGYAVVAVLIVALSTYVFWPSRQSQVAVFPAEIEPPFLVSGALGEQEVDAQRIRVAGLERARDDLAVRRFVGTAKSLTVPDDRIVDDIDAAQAKAWGIDGTRRFVMGDEERQWGEAGGAAAVWDPKRRRAFLVTPNEARRLTAAAERLDQKPLLGWETLEKLDRLTIDGVAILRQDDGWRFAQGQRPPCSGRVMQLLYAVHRVELASREGAPAEAQLRHELRLALAEREYRLRLWAQDARWWLQLDEHPAQPSGEDWSALLAAFASDRLWDPASSSVPDHIDIRQGERTLFSLARRGAYGDDGQKPWRVRWSGGDELAVRDAGERLHEAVRTLTVVDPEPSPTPPAGPEAIVISGTLTYHGEVLRLVLAGERAWAAGWAGRVRELPAALQHLQAETFLNPAVLPVASERLVKLQRRWPEASRDETYVRPPGGSWTRSYPPSAQAADPQAVSRLARALTRLNGLAVRAATASDRALPATVEIAVRVAPRSVQQTTVDDDLDLADTFPQDLAWRLAQAGDAWVLIDQIGGLCFTIGEDDAAALLAEVTSRNLFAVPPTLISAIECAGAQAWRLERDGAQWTLRSGEQSQRADAIAARRLLRALTALQALGPADAQPSGRGIALAVELVDGERLVVRVHDEGDRVLAATAHGTVRLAPESWRALVLDPAALRAP